MTLKLIVVRSDDAPLPPGSSVRVEVRDTSLADAPAVTLHRARVSVKADADIVMPGAQSSPPQV